MGSQNQGPQIFDEPASVGAVSTSEVQVAYGEEVNISLLSDLHLEAESCDIGALLSMMESRNRLPNHRCIIIGDILDMVVCRDLKRYRPSSQVKEIMGADDWVNKIAAYAAGILARFECPIDLITPGNHEDEAMKRTGVDLTSILAVSTGAHRGGYEGIHRYKLVWESESGTSSRSHLFPIAYHHGKGGGKNRGYIWASWYFSNIEGCSAYIWGHNHTAGVWPEKRSWVDCKGNLQERMVQFINTGQWVDPKSLTKNVKTTPYPVRHGYRSMPNVAPLLKIKMVNTSKGVELVHSVTLGNM